MDKREPTMLTAILVSPPGSLTELQDDASLPWLPSFLHCDGIYAFILS
jgi:hypothetical protein